MKSVNVLFVSCNGIEDKSIGGPKGTIRNYECMSKYGKITNFHIVKKTNVDSFIALIEGYYPPMDEAYIKQIEKIIEEQKIDIVFFDQSFYGNFVERCKKKGCKTIVFCHNCEVDYNKIRFTNTNNYLKKRLYTNSVIRNERKTIRSSDVVITFNERDSKRINELYNRQADYIIPLGLSDKCTGKACSQIQHDVLIFSPVTEANLYGVRWFVNNVSEQINGKILIAGRGFDEYSDELSRKNVEIKGYVKDIEDVYLSARIVAIPQFIGAGMKVKTAEALMFGKEIVGTREAFEGYDEEILDVASLCNTSEEFVIAINARINNNTSYSARAREIYLNRYSISAGNKVFNRIIQEIDV